MVQESKINWQNKNIQRLVLCSETNTDFGLVSPHRRQPVGLWHPGLFLGLGNGCSEYLTPIGQIYIK